MAPPPTSFCGATRSFLLPLLFLSSHLAHADPHSHDKDENLYSFVTRPDLKAPKWKVNITEPDLVSPGYWFLAPFESIDQHEPGNGWIGPHIYDGDGQLIWSGVNLGHNWDVLDFKMSNVRGQDLMTMLHNREGKAYVLDNNYNIREKHHVGTLGQDFNSHELNFIEDGNRILILDEGHRDATKEQVAALGYDKNCRGLFSGFKELDAATWEPIFEWSSFDHIPLEQSTFLDGGVERWCGDPFGWDYVHLNSISKDQNGDYFVSARHTDSIYKVSKDDGHVMWRLHGRQEEDGEWDMGKLSFSRQHNVRFRGFNGTHEFISILDNANGQDDQKPTHSMSRGMVIAIDVENRHARYVSTIDHPYGAGSYAPRRGNYQVMPNGHVFMGWSEQGTHSEHSADGTLLMSASMLPQWLGTYRSYKFPFVGQPTEPMRAVSAAYPSHARNSTTTMVHVSWNGATEVDHYNLYKTTETGAPLIPIFQLKRTGFETTLAWDGYASYVVIEAVDKNGKSLTRTEVVKTAEPAAEAMGEAVAEEMYWLQEMRGQNEKWDGAYSSNAYPYSSSNPNRSWNVFVTAFVALIVLIMAFFGWKALRQRGYLLSWRYSALSGDVDEESGDAELRYPSGHKRSRSDMPMRDNVLRENVER